jgi:hypothetical protein
MNSGVLLEAWAEVVNTVYVSLDFRGLMYSINKKLCEEPILPLSLHKWLMPWDKNL